jgi:hypothetical protein
LKPALFCAAHAEFFLSRARFASRRLCPVDGLHANQSSSGAKGGDMAADLWQTMFPFFERGA